MFRRYINVEAQLHFEAQSRDILTLEGAASLENFTAL